MYSILGCVMEGPGGGTQAPLGYTMVGPVRGPWANGGRSKGCGTGRTPSSSALAGGGTLGGGMGTGRTEGTARRRAAVCLCATARLVLYGTE
jgi:hypothetical protein